MPERAGSTYSELEFIVLAMLAKGVSSGYAMRKHMSNLRGCRWSTESGSIYRALARLEQAGLIRIKGRAGAPRRQRTEYCLTPRGEAFAETWVAHPPPEEDFTEFADPIRVRSEFLAILEPTTRAQTVRSWMHRNKAVLDSLKKESPRHSNCLEPEALVKYHLLLLAEARQIWLRKLLEAVKSG